MSFLNGPSPTYVLGSISHWRSFSPSVRQHREGAGCVALTMKDSPDPSATPGTQACLSTLLRRPVLPGCALSPASRGKHSSRAWTCGLSRDSSSAGLPAGWGRHACPDESELLCVKQTPDALEHGVLKERGSLCAPEIALQPAVLGLRPRLRHVCAVWVRGAGGPPDDSPNSEKVTGGGWEAPVHDSGVGSSPARPRGHRRSH